MDESLRVLRGAEASPPLAENEAAQLQREGNAVTQRARIVIEQKVPQLVQQARHVLVKEDLKGAIASARQTMPLLPDSSEALNQPGGD